MIRLLLNRLLYKRCPCCYGEAGHRYYLGHGNVEEWRCEHCDTLGRIYRWRRLDLDDLTCGDL